MKLGEFYQAAVEVGMDIDPRGKAALLAQMAELGEQFGKMNARDQRLFETERLRNPFGDTRIVCGDADTELKRVIIAIDVDAATLLLAAELTRRGKRVDAVIAHHGTAVCGIGSREDTAAPQVHLATQAGVPEARVWTLVRELVGTEDSPWDLRVVQTAEALEMPLMTVHSPADVSVDQFLRAQLAEQKPATVGELVEMVEAWPECQWLMDRARRVPWIDAGDAGAPVGTVYPCFYGGWNPSPALFEELCRAGVSSFVVVASTPEFRELAGRYGASVVVVPHYPADNVGINILLDRIFPGEDGFDIVPMGNYYRHRRS